MARLIPGKTKVEIELFKGVRLADVFVGLIGIPVNMFGSTTQADLTALGEFCFALCAGIDRNNNNTAVSLAVGDALYIGDMWLSTKDASGNWNIPAPAAKPAN